MMDCRSDPISVRVARLNAEIIGKSVENDVRNQLITREGLLDSLQALYDECCIEAVRKSDKNVASFVASYSETMERLRKSRVNLSDFEVKNCIGRGHFGDVHVVIDKISRDVHAMKSIKKCDGLNQRRTKFLEERNIMANSRSQWLTSLHYAFQDASHLYFVMEFHPGGDLLGLINKQGGTLPESAAVFYLAEILLGLRDLHEMGYVHRDIKPDNVLLDRCGHVKIADFGSAAKLDPSGYVAEGPPVGTPDYVAPEILETMENKQNKVRYGVLCDFWSVGVLAYEMTVGSTPFRGTSTTTVYWKILNHSNSLEFPPDILLSQAYTDLVRNLVVDQKSRLNLKSIMEHSLFDNLHFESLREQVPPFVPKINSFDDTSNFSGVAARQKVPSIEDFKKRTQFSGRNLPFIGFTYTPCISEETAYYRGQVKDEQVEDLKKEIEKLRRTLAKTEDVEIEKATVEKKLQEKLRKLENVESVRAKLEAEIASNLAESSALRRTLELERKDRAELEKRALELIKSAKMKWETEERKKIDSLTLTINEQQEKIQQLSETNKMLDEQVKNALKTGMKHKMSLETVENLSRRSVIGLETRLEKVTCDTQNKLGELQARLNEQFFQKTALERTINKLKDNEKLLNNKLANSEENYANLSRQIDVAERLIKELETKVCSLEKESELLENFKHENENLREKRSEDRKTIKELENKFTLLEMEHGNCDKFKIEIEELNVRLKEMQAELKKICDLEIELQKEKEKIKSLNKQLEENGNGNAAGDSNELREIRTKYWRADKELNNFKIDKRILERELKESRAENSKQLLEIRELKERIEENRKIHESSLLELNSINDHLSMELIKSNETIKSLTCQLNSERKLTEESKSIVFELKTLSNAKEEKLDKLNTEIQQTQKEIRLAEAEKETLRESLEAMQMEKIRLQNDLDELRNQNENCQLNLSALREACTLLESQVIEYEKIANSFKEKERVSNENTEKLINELCEAKSEIRRAKQQSNEEKSHRLLAETKSQRLQEEIASLQSENEAYKAQALDYRQFSNQLTEELTAAEEKINELAIVERSFERQIEDYENENCQLKERVSEYVTQLHKSREINYKLTHEVSQLKETKRILVEKLYRLEAMVEEKSAYHKERELKMDSTIKQQIKLIDYLQTKIDENQSKKKSTFTLFGHSKKENTPPLAIAMNYKDLEIQLQKERAANKLLQEEIYRTKAEKSQKLNDDAIKRINRHKSEILSPRSKVAMQKLAQSPSTQIKEAIRSKSSQRMRHNIPHRFESRLCTKQVKCGQCRNNVILGRYVCVCKECNVIVHSNCASSSSNTCGIPTEFVEHFKGTLVKKGDEKIETGSDIDGGRDERVGVESWIKVPGTQNAWEKRYAILAEDTIKLFNEIPGGKTNEPVQTFDLKPENSHGKIVMEPLLSEIENIPVAKSDLPFLLKVEVAANCWPNTQTLTILALSLEDKEKWCKALQDVLNCSGDAINCERIFSIPEDVEINCILDLTDEMKAVGTQKGLFCLYNDSLLSLEGFREVVQMELMPSAQSLIMIVIVSRKSVVVTCDLNHLINVVQCTAAFAKSPLKFATVDTKGLNGFHYVESAKSGSKHKMFCAATSKQLAIVGYEEESREFRVIRILDTAEPTGTVLFTEHSIIVGADKFFEIDIVTFRAEEFLDSSNSKLRSALKCIEMKSYPLSIVQVNGNPKEFLVAFNEFFIFVDEFGSPSRSKEWTMTRLPTAVFYAKPYLYIVEFAAVEIHKICETTCEDVEENSDNSIRIALGKFSFVGGCKEGIYVTHEGCVKLLEGRKMLSGVSDDSTTIETCSIEDRFSFTSSMVQSLDGLDNAEESVGEEKGKEKSVKFAQTSL